MASRLNAPLGLYAVPDSALGMKFCDTIDIDQDAHRLYAGDNWAEGVDVFDISTPEARYEKTIKTRGPFYGIAHAPDLKRIFVGLGAATVGVIDCDPRSPNSDTFVARIEIGAKGSADLIEYVPEHRKVYVGMHRDRSVGVIDASSAVLIKVIGELGGDIEQPRYNAADGMVYVASRAGNALHQIDPVSDTLVRTIEIGYPCNPNGVAINPATGRALLVSANLSHTIIWDLNEQRITAVIEGSGAGDGAIYEPSIDRFLAAHSSYAGGPVIGVFGGDPIGLVANIPSQPGASWVAYDRTHRLIYAPSIYECKPAVISLTLAEP